MHGVKGLSPFRSHTQQLSCGDPEPGRFEPAKDFADQISSCRIGFNNRQCFFNTHDCAKASCIVRPMVAGDAAI